MARHDFDKEGSVELNNRAVLLVVRTDDTNECSREFGGHYGRYAHVGVSRVSNHGDSRAS